MLLMQLSFIDRFSAFVVLDMSRHVPLYRAVMELLRAIALCPSLVPLLLPMSNGAPRRSEDLSTDDSSSLSALLHKMKQCVDVYSKTLR